MEEKWYRMYSEEWKDVIREVYLQLSSFRCKKNRAVYAYRSNR